MKKRKDVIRDIIISIIAGTIIALLTCCADKPVKSAEELKAEYLKKEQEEKENNEVDSIEQDPVRRPDVIIEEPTDNPVETPTVTEPSKSEHKSSNATNAVPPPPNARVKKSFEKPSNK